MPFDTSFQKSIVEQISLVPTWCQAEGAGAASTLLAASCCPATTAQRERGPMAASGRPGSGAPGEMAAPRCTGALPGAPDRLSQWKGADATATLAATGTATGSDALTFGGGGGATSGSAGRASMSGVLDLQYLGRLI